VRFELAEMSPPLRGLTLVLLALPVGFGIAALVGAAALAIPALAMVAIYGWVWLRFRPTAFVVRPQSVEVIWPLKRREIGREGISAVRVIDRAELRREVGWGMRVGAGGLWGAFGWLWTERRGIVQMYVSRLDRFVWIERHGARPWLITPDRPELFVQTLTG
jgi:hypothetical protein